MENTTKYGLFFLGGLVVGALGAMAVTRGKLEIKPLATDLISGGMELRDKVMAGVESVKEDIEDVVAEAQVKAEERRQSQEAKQAAQSVQAAQPADSEAEVAPQEKTVAAAAG